MKNLQFSIKKTCFGLHAVIADKGVTYENFSYVPSVIFYNYSEYPSLAHKKILSWLKTNCNSKFSLYFNIIAFESQSDAIKFKIWYIQQ